MAGPCAPAGRLARCTACKSSCHLQQPVHLGCLPAVSHRCLQVCTAGAAGSLPAPCTTPTTQGGPRSCLGTCLPNKACRMATDTSQSKQNTAQGSPSRACATHAAVEPSASVPQLPRPAPPRFTPSWLQAGAGAGCVSRGTRGSSGGIDVATWQRGTAAGWGTTCCHG